MNINLAFWGTPDLTTTYLDALSAAGMAPVVIITNPDRPKGRGHELTPPPAKVWGLAHNIPVLQPSLLDDAFFTALDHFNLDVSIVVAYGSIMPEHFINLPRHSTLNVHYSLLPRFRGASPIEAAILAGDEDTGCAIQIMAYKLDSGPVIAQSWTPIPENETAPELCARLTIMGAELLVEKLPAYLEGSLLAVPQDEQLATRCGKIRKEDGLIDLNGDDLVNYRKYRAYYEWPRTYFFVDAEGNPAPPDAPEKTRVIITKARYENEVFIIDKVLPEGKKEMDYADFMRGFEN